MKPKVWFYMLFNLICTGRQVQSQKLVDVVYAANNQGLTVIPADIPTEATKISLINNQLSSIGNNAFSGFPNLIGLFLKGNQIIVFSSTALAGCTKLILLYLKENQLAQVPELSAVESTITTLDLRDNFLTGAAVNSFSGLKRLRHLYLTRAGISVVPDVSDFRTSLLKLYLEENKLALSKGVLDGCTSLTTLVLSSCGLTSIPFITGLDSIQEVYLARNNFTTFPNVTNLTNLKKLYLQKNQINRIPGGSFEMLTELEGLWLNSNELRDFPDLNGSHVTLHTLELQHNRLVMLPERIVLLKNLQKLTLTGNMLTVLPDLLQMASLKELLLADNPLDCSCHNLDWAINLSFVKFSAEPCETPSALKSVQKASLTPRRLAHGCVDPRANFGSPAVDRKSSNGILSEHNVSSVIQCAALCLQDIWCERFNLGPSTGDPPMHQCHLADNSPPKYDTNPGWKVFPLTSMTKIQ